MRIKPATGKANRAGGGLPLIVLDLDTNLPLYEQIYLAIKGYVLAGELRPGARLASTRALAQELKVSRFTVVSALDRLLAEGWSACCRNSMSLAGHCEWRVSLHFSPLPLLRRLLQR